MTVTDLGAFAVARNRVVKARAVAVCWKAAGGTVELLEATLAEAALGECGPGSDGRWRARARLRLVLGAASQSLGRVQLWTAASAETWALAVEMLRSGS